jgi:hypothetical protein
VGRVAGPPHIPTAVAHWQSRSEKPFRKKINDRRKYLTVKASNFERRIDISWIERSELFFFG